MSIDRNRIAAATLIALLAGVQHPTFAQDAQPAATQTTSSLPVPKLTGITIDGATDDWGDRGLRVGVLSETTPSRKPFAGGDAALRLGWDERGLLARIDVVDDTFVESAKDDALWERDGVELFLANGDGTGRIQFIIAPGLDSTQPKPRVQSNRHTADEPRTPLTENHAVRKTPTGYVLEVLIPWSNLATVPTTASELRVQVYVNDNDGTPRNTQWLFYPQFGASSNSSRMQSIKLVDAPADATSTGAPFRTVIYGGYERFRRARINVAADVDSAGKPVEVRESGRPLTTGALVPQGRLAVASLVLPMPPQAYGPLEVLIDGKSASLVTLADPQQARADAIDRLDVVFDPSFIFSTSVLPQPEFENPNLAEDLIGPYTLTTEFYDADFKQVTLAEKPGRYGAIVSVTTDGGAKMKRFVTLFRSTTDVDFRKEDLGLTFEMPAAWAIDPSVTRDRWRDVTEFQKTLLRRSASRNGDLAVLLAGLYETKAGTPPLQRNNPWSLNETYWYELKKRTGDLVPYRYDTALPKGYDENGSKKWPLILFLHGSGERGRDLSKVLVHGPPKEARAGRDLPFVIIAPQCPLGEWWDVHQLKDLLDEVTSKYHIDADRLYLTGLSMGGYGSWRFAVAQPNTFAAVVPICGGGDPLDVTSLKDTPIWVVHGGRDGAVLPEESYRMVGALREAKGRVRFTLYPDAGHDSWTATYADPGLYEWMLQQRRGAPQERPATNPSTQPTDVRVSK